MFRTSTLKTLQVVISTQSLQEEVLLTLLIDNVEGIPNARPLGLMSLDVVDPDLFTPNMSLMGRRDSSYRRCPMLWTNSQEDGCVIVE